MSLLFEPLPGDPGRFSGRRIGDSCSQKPGCTAKKGANLPSLFPDWRWPGVHVAVAKGGDCRAVILSTIVANNLRGIATSAI